MGWSWLMRVFGFSRWGVVAFFLPLFLFFVECCAWCAFARCLVSVGAFGFVCCVCMLHVASIRFSLQICPLFYFQYTKLSEAVLKLLSALLFFVVCLSVCFIFLCCWCVSVHFCLRCIGVCYGICGQLYAFICGQT